MGSEYQFSAPRRLRRTDDRSQFDSGAPELDEWLQRYSWQNQQADNAVTYVLATENRVVAYYALAASNVSRESVLREFSRSRPAAIPCILLARLAVDREFHGRGLGKALFRDAVLRAIQTSQIVGAAALLVHSRDEVARDFYEAIGDLTRSPLDPLQLVLPLSRAVLLAE